MDRKDVFTSLFLKAAAVTPDSENIKQYKSLWWYSTRDKSEGGLRLTQAGIDFIQTESEIKTYRIELPKDITVGPQILIWLDQFLDSPFYLEKKFITVLSEKTAFELYLFSGDVKKMGASKAMNKRINQNSPA
jgi:hypothetical protein